MLKLVCDYLYVLIIIDYKEAVFAISLGILYSYKYFNVKTLFN